MAAIQILSTGSYLPGEPIDNAALERLAGPLPTEILAGIQVQTRHWIVDPRSGEHMDSNVVMAHRAARTALEDGGVAAAEVDLLVVSTASPEYPLPPLATFLQDALGLARCTALEVRSGCAGAVEALEIARLLLATGACRTALVVGTEAISPLLVPVFLGKDSATVRMRDRIGLYTFGDGAGAILLRADDDSGQPRPGSGLRPAALSSVGGGRKPGMQIFGGGTATPLHVQFASRRPVELRVDVVESARQTPAVIAEALDAVLARADVDAADVDVCILPEGNAGYLADEIDRAGLLGHVWTALQTRVVENLASVGATGSAAVPLALDWAWRAGRLRPGDEVMLLAIETSKWKYAGTVVSWSAPAPAARKPVPNQQAEARR